MPKEKETQGEFLLRVVEKHPKVFRVDTNFLFCIYCEQRVVASKIFQVNQHLQTAVHKKNEVKKKSDSLPQQSLLSDYVGPSRGPQLKEFSMDLCKMLIDVNIPVHKIEHPSFVEFIKKYTSEETPTAVTIRTNYLPVLYNTTIKKLRAKAAGKKIWVTLDECTDTEHRMVANFVFGILGDENELGKSYLLNVAELDKTNASTIAVFFNESLLLLWPSGALHYIIFFCVFSFNV